MSVLNKIWKIRSTDRKESLLKTILHNRGINTETEIRNFIYPEAARDFHDPFLMSDMKAACERIEKAIDAKERIMIFGDYDVDGITAAAILMRALTKLKANVSYRLPHRIEDGYGLREKFVKEFKKLDVKIIITVDNGISCFKEVELAASLGIDTIITDHHTIPEKLPKAFAILHPKLPGNTYPFADLTGAGVALKLAQALYIKRLPTPDERATQTRGDASSPALSATHRANLINNELRKLLDLACMGTVGDLGLLRGENRYIVKEGISVLEHTRWPGLSRLKKSAGLKGKIDTHSIGFFLGPRINAAGRISHPSHALKLLLHDEEHSALLAEKLEQLNKTRQKLTSELMLTAEILAEKQLKNPVIIISHKNFHGGIIGLLAGKLSEKYFRPAIVMEERQNTLIGSCRSIPEVNIFDALNSAKELLTHFGGHAAAAGFDLPKKNLAEFSKKIAKWIKPLLGAAECKPILFVDCELMHEDITEGTINNLRLLEPYGMGNETPRFICRNVQANRVTCVGETKKHLKINALLGERSIECIGFGLGAFAPRIGKNATLDIACELEENVWQGNKTLQLKMLDFKIR